jgi:hypothetical protein
VGICKQLSGHLFFSMVSKDTLCNDVEMQLVMSYDDV